VEREAALTAKVASLEATIRDLTQRLYGAKSEKSAGPDDADESKPSRGAFPFFRSTAETRGGTELKA